MITAFAATAFAAVPTAVVAAIWTGEWRWLLATLPGIFLFRSALR